MVQTWIKLVTDFRSCLEILVDLDTDSAVLAEGRNFGNDPGDERKRDLYKMNI